MLLLGYFLAVALFSFEPDGNNRSPSRVYSLQPYPLNQITHRIDSNHHILPNRALASTPPLQSIPSYNFAVPTSLIPSDKGTDPYLIDPHTEENHYAWDLYNRTDLNREIISFLLTYLSFNTPSYIISLGSLICERPVLIHACCGGNFGTTLFRLSSAIKMAMLLNRTMIVDVTGEDEYEYFDIPFMTRTQLYRLYRKYKCNLPGSETVPHPQHVIKLPWVQPLVKNLIEQTDLSDKSQIPSYCTSETMNNLMRDDIQSYWWIYLRCYNIMKLPTVIHVQVGDLYQFIKFIVWNPYFVNSTLYDKIIPADSIIHKEIFFLFLRPNESIRKIVMEFTQGKGFDYMIHFRTGRNEHTSPFIEAFIKTIKGDYQNEYMENKAKQLGVPLYGAPPNPLRILIASAQFPSSVLCNYIIGNVTEVQRSFTTNSNQTIAGIDCIYFDAERHSKQFGLPITLSLKQVNYSPDDWGVQPSWSAVVQIFSIYPLTFGLFGLVESSFAGLFRLVSGKESFSQHGNINNNRDLFWPF